LIIPLQASNPFITDLVLPGCSVRGEFVCSDLSENMNWESIAWQVKIMDSKNWSSFSSIQGKGKPRFEMKHLSAGVYRLEADVAAFEKYVYDEFVLEEGQDLDLEILTLKPCGVFDLMITDEESNAIQDFDLYCNGKKQFSFNKTGFGEGHFRCDKLPLGPVRLLFIAEGFERQEIDLHLEPGRIEAIKIALPSF
jgi:hypothetical protein